MRERPSYDFEQAVVKAATGAYQKLNDACNPDVVLWEALEVNLPITRNRLGLNGFSPGIFIVGLINDRGLDHYLQIRRQIAGEETPEKLAD